MRKKTVNKLFTTYIVEGSFDEIKAAGHNMRMYSAGKAECIKIHDTLEDWLRDIVNDDFKNVFGMHILSQDNEFLQNYSSLHSLSENGYEKDRTKIFNILSKIISYYINSDISYYYEIEQDDIILVKELTGHLHYGSEIEDYSDCKTCDGAKCESCITTYVVYDINTVYYKGTNFEEANKIKSEHEKKYDDVINDIINNYEVSSDILSNITSNNFSNVIKLLNYLNIPYCTK